MIPFVLNNALTLEKLGKVIRQRCKQLNLTLEDIESVTGISRKTLIKLEKGGDVRQRTAGVGTDCLPCQSRLHGWQCEL